MQLTNFKLNIPSLPSSIEEMEKFVAHLSVFLNKRDSSKEITPSELQRDFAKAMGLNGVMELNGQFEKLEYHNSEEKAKLDKLAIESALRGVGVTRYQHELRVLNDLKFGKKAALSQLSQQFEEYFDMREDLFNSLVLKLFFEKDSELLNEYKKDPKLAHYLLLKRASTLIDFEDRKLYLSAICYQNYFLESGYYRKLPEQEVDEIEMNIQMVSNLAFEYLQFRMRSFDKIGIEDPSPKDFDKASPDSQRLPFKLLREKVWVVQITLRDELESELKTIDEDLEKLDMNKFIEESLNQKN